MNRALSVVLCLGLAAGSLPALAQDAPPATTTTTPTTAPKKDDELQKVKKYFLSRPGGQPSRLERLIVAGVASVLAVAALGVGIGAGVWAYLDYQCLKNPSECNKTRPSNDQISGTNFLRRRADGERKAIVADMGYLAAATATAVAILGIASAFWPSGWWPFASEDQPADVPPRQVVTEIPAVTVDPAATPPATTTTTPPAPAPEPAPAPAPAPAPQNAPATTETTPGTGSTP